MLPARREASTQWAFYQARATREPQYRAQKLTLGAQPAESSSLKGPERARLEARARPFAEEEKRYNAEKKDIEKDARKLEHQRDVYRNRDPYLDDAQGFLQTASGCASVATPATPRPTP